MNKKNFMLLSLFACSAMTMSAQQLDSEQAAQAARAFFASHASTSAHRAPALVNPELAYASSATAATHLYIFNRDAEAKGFVIINADSADGEVYGYSADGHFSIADAPDNFRWWLSKIEAYGAARRSPSSGARTSIAPIVEARWAQDAPFNSAIPTLGSGYKPFVAGCTSIAMSQVMKHYNFPTHGKGQNSYTCGTWQLQGGNKVTPQFSADFEATTYDWENMLNDYSDGYNATQAAAVATLVYHAGAAENTSYGQETSSADDRNSGKAMIEHFCYDKSMLRAEHAFYTDEEWDDILYAEMAAGRPVIYSGQDGEDLRTSSGHTFVCDGYDATTGYYSINWGWGGSFNGNFPLIGTKALSPNGTGIGGSSADASYRFHQSINYNIKPDDGGDYAYQLGVWDYVTMATDKDLCNTVTHVSVDRAGGNDRTLYYTFTPYNYGFSTIDFEYGVMLRNVITGDAYPFHAFTMDDLAPGNYGSYTPYPSFSTEELPYNGTYEVVPVYRADASSEWTPMRQRVEQPELQIVVTGAEDAPLVDVPFTLSSSVVQVGKTLSIAPSAYYTGTYTYTTSAPEVATVSADGVITGHTLGHATITAEAAGDAHFNATVKTFDIEVVEHIVRPVVITIDDTRLNVGEEATITVTSGYDGEVTYEVADADVVSIDSEGHVVALAEGQTTVTVTAPATYDYAGAVETFIITVSTAPELVDGLCFYDNPTVGGDNVVDTAEDFVLRMPLINNTTAALSNVFAYYYLEVDGGAYLAAGQGYSKIPAGYKDVAEVDFSSKFDYLTPGKEYTVEFYSDNRLTIPMNVASIKFTRRDLSTGIVPVESTGATTVYTIDGKRASGLKPGLNIVKRADGTVNKVFVK